MDHNTEINTSEISEHNPESPENSEANNPIFAENSSINRIVPPNAFNRRSEIKIYRKRGEEDVDIPKKSEIKWGRKIFPLALFGTHLHQNITSKVTGTEHTYNSTAENEFLDANPALKQNWPEILEYVNGKTSELLDPEGKNVWIAKVRFLLSKNQWRAAREMNKALKKDDITEEELSKMLRGIDYGKSLNTSLESNGYMLDFLRHRRKRKAFVGSTAEADLIGCLVLKPQYAWIAETFKTLESSKNGKFNFLNFEKLREEEISVNMPNVSGKIDVSKISYESFFTHVIDAILDDGIKLDLVEIKTASIPQGSQVNSEEIKKKHQHDISHTLRVLLNFFGGFYALERLDYELEADEVQKHLNALQQDNSENDSISDLQKLSEKIYTNQRYKQAVETKLRKLISNIDTHIISVLIPNLRSDIPKERVRTGLLQPSDFVAILPEDVSIEKISIDFRGDERVIKSFGIADYVAHYRRQMQPPRVYAA